MKDEETNSLHTVLKYTAKCKDQKHILLKKIKSEKSRTVPGKKG